MPRAFLITHRRYNAAEEYEETVRDCSPERGVRVAEYGGGQPTSDGVSDCGSETSSECPEELYNLTKLAEVSLAAAAGTLIHPNSILYQRSESPRCAITKNDLFDGAKQQRGIEMNEEYQRRTTTTTDERVLQDKTRLFFERIEAERKILGRHSPSNLEDPRRPYTARGESPFQSDPKRPASCTSYHPESKTPCTSSVLQKKPASSQPAEDGEDHECTDCGKKYSTSSNLARHRQTHRSLGDKKARRCPHCDKVYVSMPAYSMHVRTHNQGCKCHYCGKCFSRPWLLQGHIRTHTGEKPFKCTICNKAFADKSNLRAHIQTHSNTKPHICTRCGKAFALKSYLYKHEESSCMRSLQRASSEKRDLERSSPVPKTVVPQVTASPTSVIVPRFALGRSVSAVDSRSSAFSAIQHTRGSANLGTSSENALKRQYQEEAEAEQPRDYTRQPDDSETQGTKRRVEDPAEIKGTKYVSEMVIRSSVISPNPEHLGRLGGFSPSRSSAFSRPGITLNLAIA